MGFAYEVLPPAPPLACFVENVRVVTPVDAGSMHIESMPDGCSKLLLRIVDGAHSDLTVAGPRTRALFKRAPAVESVIVVRFKPGGARRCFGLPLYALRDRFVPLDELWGSQGARLHSALLAAPSTETRLQLIERALCDRAARWNEAPADRLARSALELLARTEGERSVEQIARRIGVSARHLRRAFRESVGVAPKEFARMLRLQRALRATGCDSWTERALHAGYYDQSHLIAEFQDLIGMTPSAFTRRSAVDSGGT
jgi:AraC-like DNA-binding protein